MEIILGIVVVVLLLLFGGREAKHARKREKLNKRLKRM